MNDSNQNYGYCDGSGSDSAMTPICFTCRWSNRDSEQHFLECRYNKSRRAAEWPEVATREGHITHNALHDCIWQIDTLVECWRRLKK